MLTNIFIPPLGTKIRLTEQLSFELHYENRNGTLWNLYSVKPMHSFYSTDLRARRGLRCDVTLPEDTVLKVDRIFVRKGATNYDSVTFRAEIPIDGVIRKARFWMPLADANKIKGEIVYA